MRRAVAPWLLALALSACAGGPAPATPAPQADEAAEPVIPPGLLWVRTAAEHRAVYAEVYGLATAAVEKAAAGRAAGSWAVILDADETVLDNSLYQLRRAQAGLGYSPESWNAWVREAAAPALPGSAAFIRRVHALGGRVAIVTNRDEDVCDATRANLRDVGVEADVVLCKAPGESRKESRFQAVQQGTTPAGLPPMDVLAWVGDNIQDFPGGEQAWRDGTLPDAFGTRWFALPNPMYGSWQGNPIR